MTFDDISTFYTAHQALIASLGALAGVAVLLVAANRLRVMKEHRATLLVANLLTIIAAALATIVSASGMWKFFTDILGETPLRIAFFAFIEIALFASALLGRSRLLRDPEKGTTGIDGIAVWVLAALTATLSALDGDSFREVCLRLIAPLVAAWMWERALAAERHVRLGKTSGRINWTLTPERVFVWLRLAEASDRDVSQVDRARRRARLGQARMHLHLLQSRNTFGWRIRRAHNKVIRQAMHASEHIGLADFPDVANERQAMQMYLATLYGFVDATSPQAVAHLNAWQTTPAVAHTDTLGTTARGAANALRPAEATVSALGMTAIPLNEAPASAVPPDHQMTQDDADQPAAALSQDDDANGQPIVMGAAAPHFRVQMIHDPHTIGNRQPLDFANSGQRHHHDTLTQPAAGRPGDQLDEIDDPDAGELSGDEFAHSDQAEDTATVTAVEAMRRFWDKEVSSGRVPTGAELSRSAGVPPSTGLGRRKRRKWQAELPERLKAAANAGR